MDLSDEVNSGEFVSLPEKRAHFGMSGTLSADFFSSSHVFDGLFDEAIEGFFVARVPQRYCSLPVGDGGCGVVRGPLFFGAEHVPVSDVFLFSSEIADVYEGFVSDGDDFSGAE